MAATVENVATHVAQSLADKAMQELKYLCCYKSYVEDFEEEKTSLSAKRNTVLEEIEEARDRNENKIVSEVDSWLDSANGLIEEDTKEKKKWFGLVTNCLWQYKRGKELEGKTQRIKQLMEKSNFARVARSTGLPGIGFYASPNFMQLEGRKLTSQKLKETLRGDNKFMIGLCGLGGTGKTTMAIEVGKEVEESKVFDKVIFNVVSKDANLKKIRDNIAKHLKFPFKEGVDECEQAQQLWKRIVEGEEKVLIILDDVWEKLAVQDIGIPLGRHGKGSCSVLLTTRDWGVCRDMGCHEIIKLEVLNENDAVDLFLSYAGMGGDSSSTHFKDVALGIVKECGRLPVAIVAVARALRDRLISEWEQALERLRDLEPVHGVNEDLKEAYNSLRLSYDHLKDGKAQKLFLLCSLFPEDYEIPIELLTRVAIGLGLCGEANKYSTARSHFTPIKNELIDSCLLLKVGNEAIKMHDLVREVALWIGNTQVQAVMDSNTTLMENIIYSLWNITEFPNYFDGRKLEALLVWINNANSPTMEVVDNIFEGMENLKILALRSSSELQISFASLIKSPLSLINIRTLSIEEFKLGDISMLVNLKCLESLELRTCSIVELPKKIKELGKLRLLEMVGCVIERNNPFEVIGSCLQLEELYYVSNYSAGLAHESQAFEITQFPQLQRYHIEGYISRDSRYWRDYQFHEIIGKRNLNFSTSRYFDSKGLRVNFSNEIFKSLVERIEGLELDGDYNNKGWTNVLDILSMEDHGGMKDHLTRLCLISLNEIKFLIHTDHLRSGVAIFSKLVELYLYCMDMRKLCSGPYPVDFLRKLKNLHLSSCGKLESPLFDGKLELYNLQSICINECSLTCLFHPSTAQSLKQLDNLEVTKCLKMTCIVAETMETHDTIQKSHDSMFPKLQRLKLQGCPEIEYIVPICFCEDLPLLESMEIKDCEELKYIFGQNSMGSDLHPMGKEAILQMLKKVKICRVPKFINIYVQCYIPLPCSEEVRKSSPSTKIDVSSTLSRGHHCCCWPKSIPLSVHQPSSTMTIQMNHKKEPKVNYVVYRAHGFFTPPLCPYKSLRRMEIDGLRWLKSLFTVSIASSLRMLELLQVKNCNTLEQIVTEEEHGHDDLMNVSTAPHQVCLPKLCGIEVKHCKSLKCLFPTSCGKLPRLLYVDIEDVPQLGHVFEWKQGEGQKLVMEDVFPKLSVIRLVNLPSLYTFCPGIDFQNVKVRIIRGCPVVSLSSAHDSYSELYKLFRVRMTSVSERGGYIAKVLLGALQWEYASMKDSEKDPTTTQKQKSSTSNLTEIEEEESQDIGKDSAITQQNNSSLKFEIIEEEGSQEDIGDDSTMPQQNNGSPKFENRKEVSKETAKKESTTHEKNSNLTNLTESNVASANEIIEEKPSTTPSSNSNMNLKETLGEGLSFDENNKSSSSTYSKTEIDKTHTSKELCRKESMSDDQQVLGEKRSSNEAPLKIKESTSECFSQETSNKMMASVSSATHVKIISGDSAITDQSTHGQIMVNQRETSIEEDDLIRIFRIMRDGFDDLEVGQPYISNISVIEDSKVAKAFADIESTLRMDLNLIANSQEHTHCLENALNFLSTHLSEDGSSSHGLIIRGKVDSLRKEIRRILSSFKQASDTLVTFSKLTEKEKWIDEQHSQRMKAATDLVSEICNTESSMIELKEQISILKAELTRKEKEFGDCETKLSSLHKRKKDCVLETIRFMEEYEVVKKDKSYVGGDQTKASQELEKLENQWPTCMAELRKNALLLRILLNQKP